MTKVPDDDFADLRQTDLEDVDEEFLHIDPLRESYREAVLETPEQKKALKQHHIALMVIDLQFLDAAQGFGVFDES